MRYLRVFLGVIIPVFVFGQNPDTSGQGAGVRFEQRLSWDSVKQRARIENKYIFVDCYATWCAPCKYMDQRIYTKKEVGDLMNADFISVGVQVDTSKTDDSVVRSWYAQSHSFVREFNIASLPTFLFFSPDGKIVHKDMGSKEVGPFLKVAMDAMNPEKQYYTLLEQYRSGSKDYKKISYLAYRSLQYKDPKLANELAFDYMDNYLLKLGPDKLFTKDNVDFMATFIQNAEHPTETRAFRFFYDHAKENDSVTTSGLTRDVVKYIAIKENIFPVFDRLKNEKDAAGRDPDWVVLEKKIDRKFGSDCARRSILDARIYWYSYTKKWPLYCEAVVEKVQLFGPYGPFDRSWQFNQDAWDMFQHSTDKTQLTIALGWSDSSIRLKPAAQYYDTYANLLYKIGKTDEAIEWEEKAIGMDARDPAMKKRLDKMKRGEPTW